MDLKIAESLYLNLELLIKDLNSVSSTIQLLSCNGCGCNSERMDTSDARGEGLGEGSREVGAGLGLGEEAGAKAETGSETTPVMS